MIIVKSSDEISRMRKSGHIAALVRDSVVKQVVPGVSTKELDEYAARTIRGYGAESAFLGYRGFPGNICLSVNEEVVHGIPAGRRIEVGDVVSVDVGVLFERYYGDTATTVMVGVSDLDVLRLVSVTEEALMAGIAQARAGNRLSDVSHAIELVAVNAGFSVVRDFVGHGIGRALHEDPQVPNFGKPGRGPKLTAGMTLAIEPMVNMGVASVEVMSDGWTVRTADRKPSAHFEHTIVVRDGAAEILTE
ncbi:MAG: type I methionyl aminopeptidase [bacterium]